jgi:hypothetical protein
MTKGYQRNTTRAKTKNTITNPSRAKNKNIITQKHIIKMKTEIKNRRIEEMLVLKNPIGDFKQIEVGVSFTSGGMNYFSGTSSPRGYRLYCAPCNVSEGFRQCILMSGKRDSGLAYRICEAPRYNAKTLKMIAEQVDAQKIADLYEAEDDNGIMAYLFTLSTPRLTATATGV